MSEHIKPIIDRKTHTPNRSWWQRLLALLIVLLILGAGFFGARHLLKSKPKAKRQAPQKMVTLVETALLSASNANVTITAYGKVMPAKEVNLKARVSGEVVYSHPQLLPGGIIAAGEIVVRLDDADYKIILRQKKNALAKAEADLRIEQGRQAVARREWKLINELSNDLDQSSEDLALRRPQLAQVESEIDLAKANIAKAELDLSRTIIKAPFRAVVRREEVSLGSLISTQSSIATLVSVESFWAELSMPMSQVPWMIMTDKEGNGVEVTVFSSEKKRYAGRIIRMLPDLDQNGMMARVLIEIDDPMGLESGNPPLPIGSFITAELKGRKVNNCCQIPRYALRDGDKIFVAGDDNTLQIEAVSVVWSDNEWVFIDETDHKLGARVIVSKIAAPIAGMPLKIVPLSKDH